MGSLRLALALCVFLSHIDVFTWPGSFGAWSAVQTFFVMSGYILAHVHAQKFTASPSLPSDALRFYLVRWRSLLPPYAVTVGVYAVLVLAQSLRSGHPYHPLDLYRGADWDPLTLAMFAQATVTMVGLNILGWPWLVVPPTWTLGIESMFWLLAVPLFRLRALPLVLLGIAFTVGDRTHWITDHSPLLGFQFFILGILAHRAEVHWGDRVRLRSASARWWMQWAMPVLALAMICGGDHPTWIAMPLVAALALPSCPKREEATRLDGLMGDLSYPFYLVHVPCMNIASVLVRRQAGDPVTLGFAAVALGLALAAAWSMHRWLPRPRLHRLYRGWGATAPTPDRAGGR